MALRRLAAAILSAVVSAAVVTAAPAIAASTFTVSGTRIFHPPPYPEQLVPALFADDVVTRIEYPAAVFGMDSSVAVAAAGLGQALADTVGPVVAAGFSQGAIAVAYAKQALMSLPPEVRPEPDRVSFVTIGDPTGAQGILRTLPFRVPLLGLTPIVAPETPYDTVIVNGEYDGWADFPDRPWNLVSLANALLGIAYVHGGYEMIPGGIDLSGVPDRNITSTTNSLGGTTTVYLVPTQRLPLVQPLRDIGISERIVTALEARLKAIVDAGYARNDPAPPGAAVTPVRVPPARSTVVTGLRSPTAVAVTAGKDRAAAPAGPLIGRSAAVAKRRVAAIP